METYVRTKPSAPVVVSAVPADSIEGVPTPREVDPAETESDPRSFRV